VLTARHCVEDAAAPELDVDVVSASGTHTYAVAALHRHPELDLAALELDAAPDFDEVGTIAWSEHVAPLAQPGSDVQTAGFGVDEAGRVGTRRFGVEQVLNLDEEHVVVSARGHAGACDGDSGGPLLVRGEGGHVLAVGVLSKGAVSCYGVDRYTRLDAAARWLRDEVGDPSAASSERDHETVGSRGRCFGARAVWTDAGALVAEQCEPPRACGFDTGRGGFRCVEPAVDPCRGVNQAGACDGDTLLRCDDGVLEDTPCDACGFHCARSPRTGAFACFATRGDAG
jgi:hypothetical protein